MTEVINLELFDYNAIKKNSLIIIIHPNQNKGFAVVHSILNKFKFHMGDIFSTAPGEFKCRPIEECDSDYLQDLFGRQGGNFQTTIMESRDKEVLKKLDEKSQVKYLKQFEPLHFLPRRIFNDTLPMEIYNNINRFLIIPESYLVIHCDESVDGKFWKRAPLKKCMTDVAEYNSLTRIISCTSCKDISPKIFSSAQFLFLFSKDQDEIKTFHKKAKLSSTMGTSKEFYEAIIDTEDDDSKHADKGFVFQPIEHSIKDETSGKQKTINTIVVYFTILQDKY